MGSTTTFVVFLLVHVLAIVAVFHVYMYHGINCAWMHKEENCSHTIADLIPTSLLHLKVASALVWLAISLLSLYCFLVVYILYRVCFARVDYSANIVDNLDEEHVGHVVTLGRTKRQVANMMRQMRQSGKIPPVYPNGWYEVMRSEELAIGEVKAVSMIGEQFAVFRGENGQVSVTDAYCPHLGAHLGVGGQVKGNCIECPFHGWRFDGETGKCINIPYASKVPAFAKVKVWTSTECSGMVLVWYDAEGRDPSYMVQEYDEIKTGQWTCKGRITHYIPCHIQVCNRTFAVDYTLLSKMVLFYRKFQRMAVTLII